MAGTAERILRDFTTIAVVGLSRHPAKAAHSVPAAMHHAGFRIIPVNPNADPGGVLFGAPVYRNLAEAAEAEQKIEVVNVFRPAAEAASVARHAVRVGADALWLQQDIVSAEARALAEAAGMLYVEDECMAVVRARAGIEKPSP